MYRFECFLLEETITQTINRECAWIQQQPLAMSLDETERRPSTKHVNGWRTPSRDVPTTMHVMGNGGISSNLDSQLFKHRQRARRALQHMETVETVTNAQILRPQIWRRSQLLHLNHKLHDHRHNPTRSDDARAQMHTARCNSTSLNTTHSQHKIYTCD